jgi:hypothetical protein
VSGRAGWLAVVTILHGVVSVSRFVRSTAGENERQIFAGFDEDAIGRYGGIGLVGVANLDEHPLPGAAPRSRHKFSEDASFWKTADAAVEETPFTVARRKTAKRLPSTVIR